jgi:hypothetical protein
MKFDVFVHEFNLGHIHSIERGKLHKENEPIYSIHFYFDVQILNNLTTNIEIGNNDLDYREK